MDLNSLIPANNPSWFVEYKDLLLVLAGGFCAAFGGFMSTWFMVKNARKIKIAETIGQQQVDAYKKAMRLAGQLNLILIQGVYKDVLSFMSEENPWVIDNAILLPPKFVEYWCSIRLNVSSAQRKETPLEGMSEGPERDKRIEEIVQINEFNRKLAKDAEEEIRKELDLPPFKIHHPQKQIESD